MNRLDGLDPCIVVTASDSEPIKTLEGLQIIKKIDMFWFVPSSMPGNKCVFFLYAKGEEENITPYKTKN